MMSSSFPLVSVCSQPVHRFPSYLNLYNIHEARPEVRSEDAPFPRELRECGANTYLPPQLCLHPRPRPHECWSITPHSWTCRVLPVSRGLEATIVQPIPEFGKSCNLNIVVIFFSLESACTVVVSLCVDR